MRNFLLIIMTICVSYTAFSAQDIDKLISEVVDEEFITKKGVVKTNYAAVFKEDDGTDKTRKDNIIVASRRLGDHFYSEGDVKTAAEYYMIVLNLDDDELLISFLNRKRIFPPYSLENIEKGLG